eukprot:CAMPEP_0174894204 /NCGR_PEP_ID=MMETSP0167-20121228/8880_1 /TAXON_ID=38298 /ORGANISM="Rhodella maculata, Strain CCMP736" /LENGTH=70 /DNA_ID=CAMNT_0016133221 /DNA_START=568 /DNA_END=780 /DNA_ORIENTATION=-
MPRALDAGFLGFPLTAATLFGFIPEPTLKMPPGGENPSSAAPSPCPPATSFVPKAPTLYPAGPRSLPTAP